MTTTDNPNLLDRLLERCQQGDLQAFDQLCEAQMERIYRLAATIVRDEKDAEDIVQETLLRLFRQINGCTSDRGAGDLNGNGFEDITGASEANPNGAPVWARNTCFGVWTIGLCDEMSRIA